MTKREIIGKLGRAIAYLQRWYGDPYGATFLLARLREEHLAEWDGLS